MPHESPQMKPRQPLNFLIDPPCTNTCFLYREEATQGWSQVKTERYILVNLKNRVTSIVFIVSNRIRKFLLYSDYNSVEDLCSNLCKICCFNLLFSDMIKSLIYCLLHKMLDKWLYYFLLTSQIICLCCCFKDQWKGHFFGKGELEIRFKFLLDA